jgi:hypothetical protein
MHAYINRSIDRMTATTRVESPNDGAMAIRVVRYHATNPIIEKKKECQAFRILG